MITFYLASRYSDREKLKEYRTQLEEKGYGVASSWLDTEWPIGENRGQSAAAPPEYRATWAQKDLQDVFRASAIVNFSCGGKGRGGRHVEFGYALACGKYMVLIGEPEHVFHEHPDVERYTTWEEFYETLENRNDNADRQK